MIFEIKEASAAGVATSGHDLPDEMVLEILLRLPIKSLLKFRCVSKSWYLLISSDNFSTSHLQYSKTHDRSSSIMLHNYFRPFESEGYGTYYVREFKHCSLGSLLDEQNPYADLDVCGTETDFRDYAKHRELYSFVDSCDGLICLAVGPNMKRAGPCYRRAWKREIREKLIIWNPSIRKSKQLLDFGHEINCYRIYGFGFDKSSQDYKVVAFYLGDDTIDVIVKIYGLKTGELKRINNHRGAWLRWSPPFFANEKLHWFVSLGVDPKPFRNLKPSERGRLTTWGIAYLDLQTKEYGILDKKPDCVEFGFVSVMSQAEGGGQGLHVFSSNEYVEGTVWKIEGCYSDKETWTKMHNIRLIDGFHGLVRPLHLVVDSGDVVSLCCGRIVVFNIRTGSFKIPEMRNCDHMLAYLDTYVNYVSAISYSESFLHPWKETETELALP